MTSNNMALIVPAVFVSCIAVVALSTNFGRAEPATNDAASKASKAKDCLSSPGGTAPEGSHWYYRVDRANNNRHCWYLGARGKLARQAVSTPAQPAASQAAPQAPTQQAPASPAPLQQAPSQSSAPSLSRAQPVPRDTVRQEDRPVETRVESPIDKRSDIPTGSSQEESPAAPNDIVTAFSEGWPSLPRTRTASGSRVSAMTMGYADERSLAGQEPTERDNIPLIRPVNSEADGANAKLSMVPGGTIHQTLSQRLLPWISAAFVLAGILFGLIYRLTAPRQQSRSDRWDPLGGDVRVKLQPSGGAGPYLGQTGLAQIRLAQTGLAQTGLMQTGPSPTGPEKGLRDHTDAALTPSSTGTAAGSARTSLDRRGPKREYEESLIEILGRLKRSAA